jgi:hypothetical protein
VELAPTGNVLAVLPIVVARSAGMMGVGARAEPVRQELATPAVNVVAVALPIVVARFVGIMVVVVRVEHVQAGFAQMGNVYRRQRPVTVNALMTTNVTLLLRERNALTILCQHISKFAVFHVKGTMTALRH